MSSKNIPFRRKKEGKTNYKKRLSLLVSKKHRVIIRKSLKSVLVQIVEYNPDGDKVLVSARSRDLKAFGFNYIQANIPVAYLVGLLCGKKALEKGLKEAIVDFGLQRAHTGGKLYAAVKGLVDSGLEVPCTEDVFPSEDRISGKHIESYAAENKDKFSEYASVKLDPTSISKTLEEVKQKILG